MRIYMEINTQQYWVSEIELGGISVEGEIAKVRLTDTPKTS